MDIRSVLIVDDEKNIRLTLSEVLADMDLRVETASDGEAALAALDRESYWLILLDLKMPGLEGMDVLRWVRKKRPEIDVVIITAHGTIDNAVEAMKLGAVDYLRKPFSPQEVRELVGRMIDREKLECDKTEEYEVLIESARRAIARHEIDVAGRCVSDALRLDARQPEAHNLLGVLYEIAGDRYEAQQRYRRALELDPGYAPALANLRESVEPDRKISFFLGEAKIDKNASPG